MIAYDPGTRSAVLGYAVEDLPLYPAGTRLNGAYERGSARLDLGAAQPSL